jgi:16S rRNA (guanine527-N7)-methyltransferase
MLDLGSGGGLPGLAIALSAPDLEVSLLEATGKKVEFLRHAVRELDIQNVRVLHGRAEIVAQEMVLQDRFEASTARALARLDVLLEYSAPFLSLGGSLLAMKGQVLKGELLQAERAAQTLNMERREVREIRFLQAPVQKERHLVVFTKQGETPNRFPRREGMAAKRPLGGT